MHFLLGPFQDGAPRRPFLVHLNNSHPLTYTCVLHKADLYVVDFAIRAASAHNGHPGHLQSRKLLNGKLPIESMTASLRAATGTASGFLFQFDLNLNSIFPSQI